MPEDVKCEENKNEGTPVYWECKHLMISEQFYLKSSFLGCYNLWIIKDNKMKTCSVGMVFEVNLLSQEYQQ